MVLLLSYYYAKEVFKINTLKFNDYEEFACKIADDFDAITGDYKDVSIIAKYEDARNIISSLICIGYPIKQISDLDAPDFDGYDDEYIISLSNIDNISEIWCEPFKRENGYITDESTITYVFDNCNSKCLEKLDSKLIFEVSIGEDECESCNLDTSDSESTYISRTKDGKVEGFHKSWTTQENGVTCCSSYSHYGSDEDMVKKIARDFGINI